MLDGIVTLAEPDLFYTGGTLIFDHGHGISTLYMHMEKTLVKKDMQQSLKIQILELRNFQILKN